VERGRRILGELGIAGEVEAAPLAVALVIVAARDLEDAAAAEPLKPSPAMRVAEIARPS
jgi:hypothetical protein